MNPWCEHRALSRTGALPSFAAAGLILLLLIKLSPGSDRRHFVVCLGLTAICAALYGVTLAVAAIAPVQHRCGDAGGIAKRFCIVCFAVFDSSSDRRGFFLRRRAADTRRRALIQKRARRRFRRRPGGGCGRQDRDRRPGGRGGFCRRVSGGNARPMPVDAFLPSARGLARAAGPRIMPSTMTLRSPRRRRSEDGVAAGRRRAIDDWRLALSRSRVPLGGGTRKKTDRSLPHFYVPRTSRNSRRSEQARARRRCRRPWPPIARSPNSSPT